MRGTALSPFLGVISISMLIATLCALGCGPNSDDSKLRELERIQNTLPVFPPFGEASEHRISKGTLATISKLYKSEASYDEVKSFYVAKLIQAGWQFLGERSIKDWGTDLGGQQLQFRNGEFSLSISYAGKDSTYGWTYAVETVWNK